MVGEQTGDGQAKSGLLCKKIKGRIINIQGTNGSGKTTLAKNIIKAYGLKESNMIVGGKERTIQTNDDGTIVVLGKYDGVKCGGCDTIASGALIKNMIATAYKNGAKTIIYEGVIISGNCTFASEIYKAARAMNYEFNVVYLARDTDKCLNAVNERNGGKPFNLSNVIRKANSVKNTMARLKQQGIRVTELNPDDYPESELYKYVKIG